MTQMIDARNNRITRAMIDIKINEQLPTYEPLLEGVANGTVIIPANINHKHLKPIGIGRGLKTKVNANIGTSPDKNDLEYELNKLKTAVDAGADTIMDLSTAGDLDTIRREIIAHSEVPIGTVPIYQAAIEAKEGIVNMSVDQLFDVIEKHAADGVDFITVHCGVTQNSIDRLRKQGRLTDIVSRGGSFLTHWMIKNSKENPLYEHYDRLLSIAKKYDLTLSLGDGLRPGCIKDATDRAQVQETIILGELADRAWRENVQVMIEGPGHVPLSEIAYNVQLEKKLCRGAPFYVLGPLPTDIAPGYDHIVGAIGGAIAAASGADFLCYVTPAEHLGLPTVEDVKEGVIASKIAAHIGDLEKGIHEAIEHDNEMAKARKQRDWKRQIELSIDPEKAETYRAKSKPGEHGACTMCGEYCAIKMVEEYFKK